MKTRALFSQASLSLALAAAVWMAGCDGLRQIGAGKPDGGATDAAPADHPGAGGSGAAGTWGTGGRGGTAGTGSGGSAGSGAGGAGGVGSGGSTGAGGRGGAAGTGAGGSGCPSNQHSCSGACVSNTSTASCGTRCGTPCPAPAAHGQATCDGTSCNVACDSTYRLCPTTTICVANGLPNCCVDADCTAVTTGTKGVCGAGNVCTYPCNTPAFKLCGAACIPAAQCCTSPECAAATPATPICTNGACVAACKAFGATGCSAGGCCAANNTCVGNTCAETACQPDGHACTGPAECCTGICLQGRCGCVGVGNDCRYDHDCCSTSAGSKCSNNLDPSQPGVCISCAGTGGLFQSCTSNTDCCGLMCNIINGSICDTPGIALVGQACTNPLVCVSSSCAGVCQPTCLDLGQTCTGDADCCSRKCLGSVCAYTGCGAAGSSCITAKNCCSNVCQANLTCN